MSSPMGVAPRTPRGTGLKKPRPLRSVSLQEPSKENADLNVTFHRQISDGAQVREVTAKQPIAVCKEIAALSAKLVSEAAEESKEENPGYERQIKTRQQTEHNIHRHSMPLDSHTSKPFFRNMPKSFTSTAVDLQAVDMNSNNVSSTPVVNRNAGAKDQRRVRWCISEDLSDQVVDFDAGNTSLSPSDYAAQQDKSDKVSLATLMTESGEDLVLTGRNMKTILCASRVLLREMKAKIVRIEEIPHSDPRLHVSSPQSAATDILPENTALPDSPTDSPPQMPLTSRSKHKYSKRHLLEISRVAGSHMPPAHWNVLSITCGDVCLPSAMVTDYFDPDFFVRHDGTLVMEDYRSRRVPE